MNIKLALIAAALLGLSCPAFAENFNLGDLSEYKTNNCPTAKGAFQITIEGGGEEAIFEAPNPTHSVMFLVCNMSGHNNITIRADQSDFVGAINKDSCIIAAARTRLELSNSDGGTQLACVKPFKMTPTSS